MDKSFKDFLFFCLHEDAAPKPSFSAIDWQELLEFGRKQSIVGILFHGIKKLSSGEVSIPSNIIKEWFKEAVSLTETNHIVFDNNGSITRVLYHKYGYRACTLKGQGNALMYPNPFMRVPGDIDLWLSPNAGETEDDIIRFCRKIDENCKMSYHHADMVPYKGTVVEIHFHPSFVENLFYNRRLQGYFDSNMERQFHNLRDLPEGMGKICTPTDDFNLVFQLSHIQRHFFFEGIGMRHLIDYYYLLRRGFTQEQRDQYASTVRYLGMTKFARGIMYVMQEYLGLEEKYLLLNPNPRIGHFIMDEVLKTGNFGHNDNRFLSLRSRNRFIQALYSIVKEFRFVIEFPGEVLFGHAVWIVWWHFYYRHKIDKILQEK